jgi:hypothetical protein
MKSRKSHLSSNPFATGRLSRIPHLILLYSVLQVSQKNVNPHAGPFLPPEAPTRRQKELLTSSHGGDKIVARLMAIDVFVFESIYHKMLSHPGRFILLYCLLYSIHSHDTE